MLVTIHQPDFLPWLGFFDRWKKSDLFIILDDVQFIRRGWHHRDKIMTPDGIKWLTVPVKKKGRYLQKINEVEIDYSSHWQKKNLNMIQSAYAKAANFINIYDDLLNIFSKDHARLMNLNIDLMQYCSTLFQIDTPTVFSSSISTSANGTKRLVELVSAVGGTGYLTGHGSKGYLNEDLFSDNNIKVFWQDFDNPVYSRHNGGSDSMLSAIDYMMVNPNPYSLFN